jgi:hypothetical protein
VKIHPTPPMKIELEKSSGRAICRNFLCKNNPLYINPSGRIKSGTTCVVIGMSSAGGWNRSFYCRECIEIVYADLKTKLNPLLWVFL